MKWLVVLGWLVFCLLLAFVASFWPAHADGFDYRDKRGVRHWNHYGKHHARASSKGRTAAFEVVNRGSIPRARTKHRKHSQHHVLHIRIVKDRVKFVPVPETPQSEPVTPAIQWPLKGETPWGNLPKCCVPFDWE